MQITIGSPVKGKDFYPRQSVIDQLIRALVVEHVLFLAPRRTGKTSILLRLCEVAPAQVVYIDLEGLDHPKFWIQAMIDKVGEIKDERWLKIIKEIPDFLRGFKSEIIEISELNWENKANQLMKALSQLNTPVWFLLDEFPIMVDHIARRHGAEEASAALHRFRRIRQQNIDSPVRFLLTGSIGLDSVMQRHGLRGPANDLRREVLHPLLTEEAVAFALQLANDNRIALDEIMAREFINRLGPAMWPFFIQLFVAECQDYIAHSGNPVNTNDLDAILRKVTIGRRNQYADNMWTRLRDIFNATEVSAARQILKMSAAHDNGLPLENLFANCAAGLVEEDFRTVLETLQHDGYLTELADGNIAFFSHLLRDYWRHKGRI